MKTSFAAAILLSTVAQAATAGSPNVDLGGTHRMQLNEVRTENGGLTSVIRDTNFRLDEGNQSYLFMDTSMLFSTEKTSYRALKSKVDQYRASQIMKKQSKGRLGGGSHRLGQAVSENDIKLDLVYGFDYLYSGSIYVGESNMELKLIYDTGSDMMLIEGRDCDDCLGNRYDPNTSSYYAIVNPRTTQRKYGNLIHVEGKIAQDQICLQNFEFCIEPFQFFVVNEQFGIPEEVDGILGLAQGYAPRDGLNMPSDFEIAETQFLDVLFEAQHILEKSFSTYFTGKFGESFVDFGPARESEMSDPAEFVEIAVNKGYFYSVVPQGVKFGKVTEADEFGLGKLQAIFTTGVHFNMVPSSVSQEFFKRLLLGVDYYEENGVYYTNCGYEMRDLWFMVEEHWIQIRGQDLLTDLSESRDNTLCMVNFLPSVDDFWVFGNTIYKDYYVYHNPESGIMGWVPTAQRFKSPLIEGVPPTRDLSFAYDFQFAYLKIGVMFAVWAFTMGTAAFVFTKDFSGVKFLNKSSFEKSTLKARKQLVDQIESLSEDSLKQMLEQAQASNQLQ